MIPKYPVKAKNNTNQSSVDIEYLNVWGAASANGAIDLTRISRISTELAVTLTKADAGTTIISNSGDVVTFTVPKTSVLGANFMCSIINLWSDPAPIVAASGVTIRNNGASLAQYGKITIEAVGTDEYLISPALT